MCFFNNGPRFASPHEKPDPFAAFDIDTGDTVPPNFDDFVRINVHAWPQQRLFSVLVAGLYRYHFGGNL